MTELYLETEEYFESLGFEPCGQYEWNNDNWTIEYMGTTERPNMWRINDNSPDGFQLLFLDIKTKEDEP